MGVRELRREELGPDAPQAIRVLLVGRWDALDPLAERLQRDQTGRRLAFTFAPTVEAALDLSQDAPHELCILDGAVGEEAARKMLRGIRARRPPVPVLVLARSPSDGVAVQALQEGARDYLLWSETDATTLFRTLRALLRAEALERERLHWYQAHRRLFRSSLAPAFRLRLDGRVEDCNEAFARALGYESSEQVAGGVHLEPYGEGSGTGREVAEPDAGWIFDVAPGVPWELAVRRRDGSPLRVEMCCHLLEPVPGASPMLEGTLQPLDPPPGPEGTAHQLFEGPGTREEGLLVVRSDGTLGGWNAEAARLLGRVCAATPRPGDRLRLDRVVDDRGRPLAERLDFVERVLKGSESLSGLTLGLLCGDEEPIWVSVSTTQMSSGSGAEPWAILVSLVDDAATRRVEQQMLQAQKMEVMGHLLGSVAHDFRNLLTAIEGYSQVLLRGLDKDDARRAAVREIFQACRTASGLTGQLLAFSRRQEPKTELFELGHVVANLRGLLDRLVGRRGELEVELAAAGAVRADPVRVEQVLMNLVVNARDALDGDGRIVVTAMNVDVPDARATAFRPDPEGDWVMLAVTDNGVGMDEATRRRVFEPFFTTKETGKGTGLGLTTVSRIVEAAGGRVRVESAPGEGTTVRVFLPRVKGGPQTHADA